MARAYDETDVTPAGTKQIFHGYCWFGEDETTVGHGLAIVSPNCRTADELRVWIRETRANNAEKPGFTFRAFRREYLIDDRGRGIAGTSRDSDLMADDGPAKDDYRMVWLEQTLRTLHHEVDA